MCVQLFRYVWNAKLTQTQISVNYLSLNELESSLIEIESSVIELESSLIQLVSSLIQLVRSLIIHI